MGCTDCELDEHDCNPLNNAGCPEGFKCSWQLFSSTPYAAYFTCRALAEEPLSLGEGDCLVDNKAADQLCDFGLACLNSNVLDACPFEGCCTEYCDTAAGAGSCTDPAHTCTADEGLLPGLPDVGVCRP